MKGIFNWLNKKENWFYIFLLVLGIAVATYKYNFLSAVTGFGTIILFGLLCGYLINKVFSPNSENS